MTTITTARDPQGDVYVVEYDDDDNQIVNAVGPLHYLDVDGALSDPEWDLYLADDLNKRLFSLRLED